MLWLAVGEGALMSILLVAYLTFSGRLPNQPLKGYNSLVFMALLFLTAILISLTLGLLGIRGIHQRDTFGGIVIGIFVGTGVIMTLVLNLRRTPTSGKGGS